MSQPAAIQEFNFEFRCLLWWNFGLSKDLQKRGFTFVGSTICYAFMQAVGMVNDHVVDCFRYAQLK